MDREVHAIHEHAHEETPVERKVRRGGDNNFERRQSDKVSKAMALMNKYSNLRKSDKSDFSKSKENDNLEN